MCDVIPILLIAIALSMDTFSASLSLGTLNISKRQALEVSSVVGIMHFIMPLLGMNIGKVILKMLPFEPDFFLGIIFLILAIKMIYDVYVESKTEIDLSVIGIILFSFGVSMDAFTTGVGLLAITSNILLSTLIFMSVSYAFTLTAIIIGKYINKRFSNISSLIGILILIIMSLYLII